MIQKLVENLGVSLFKNIIGKSQPGEAGVIPLQSYARPQACLVRGPWRS